MTERTTRDVILDAARPLFAERGFNGTTIRTSPKRPVSHRLS